MTQVGIESLTVCVFMNGLQIYTNPSLVERPKSNGIYYSRRSGGPLYRWSYEEKLEQWRPVRMQSADSSAIDLSPSKWKSVPVALQIRLKDHYQE